MPAVLAALVIIYGMIASRYYRVFLPGTVINEVNVSGMTAAKAESTLIEEAQTGYTLELMFRGGETAQVTGESLDLRVTYSDEITDVLQEQNPFSWLLRLMGRGGVSVKAAGLRLYDTGKLKSWLMALPQLQTENMAAPEDACMTFDEDGMLTVQAEILGTTLDTDETLDAVEDAVASGETQLNLDETEGVYSSPAITSTNAVLLEQIEQGNRYLQTSVTYTFHSGAEVTLDAGTIKDWLAEREGQSGWYYLDQNVLMDNITEYVQSLSDNYNAYYDTYDFQSTSEGYITLEVNSGSYGFVINRSSEAEKLFVNIINGETVTREPVYGVATSLDDGIGGTYIEVDTIQQKVYLYVDGVNTFTTDCVTGLATDPERVTPSGLYTLYNMETDRTLQGTVEEDTGQPEYSSAVSYWMPFYGGYGLHDATWRSAFGGTIYQTNGSHGCVNLPYAAAKTIYESVTVGTPVIVI